MARRTTAALLRRLSQFMVLRILYAARLLETGDKQREVLGEAVLADSIASLRNRHPRACRAADSRKSRLTQENYQFFAVELVLTCVGRNLKKYS